MNNCDSTFINVMNMKRKLDENGEGEGPPKHMYAPMQPYGVWQSRGQGNMRGGGMGGGGGGGFRGGRGPWRGPRMPNNHGPRRFFRGNRGRGGPSSYPYDNNSQQYNQNNPWHQSQQYSHEHHHPYPENENHELDTSQGGSGNTANNNCPVGQGTGAQCNWNERREITTITNNSGNPGKGTNNTQGTVVMEESYTITKVKRRPMSQSYSSKPWNKEDAEKALAVETAYMKEMKNESLIIRFPDPDLTKDIVKQFHPGIENVHFQVPSSPRYCFVQLGENINPDDAIKELSKVDFGCGKLTVEKKFSKEEEVLKPEAIDPYTLYIGNLPTNVNVATVKEKFPTASRVDVGFAQRMKFTRYAFIRYSNVDDAIEAFKLNHHLLLESRSLIVRFRRLRGPIGLPGESRQQKPPKAQKKESAKPKKDKDVANAKDSKAKLKEEIAEDDEDEDEDDTEDDEDDDEDDSDDDDDDSDDDDDDDDDDEDEDDDDVGPDAPDDEPDNMDDNDSDTDEDDDDDEDNDGISRRLFQQIDAQIQGIDGSFNQVSSADSMDKFRY